MKGCLGVGTWERDRDGVGGGRDPCCSDVERDLLKVVRVHVLSTIHFRTGLLVYKQAFSY